MDCRLTHPCQHWPELLEESPTGLTPLPQQSMLSTEEYKECFGWAFCAPDKKDETRPGNASDAKSRKSTHPAEGSLERDLSLSGWRIIWLNNITPNIVRSEGLYGRQ